ncbi:hypothetical protein DFH09DRAFT_1281795 [Mycena vulgaris]|nr:hypothetical protein DFH09DRAFT_1281795 [Mycena vulgaris]
MTIQAIPQELINAIIEEVDDNRSLKACALVASTFRRMSQRILLRSLTFDDCYTWKYDALSALLTESPHVAAYVKRFTLRLSANRLFSDPDRLLSKLAHVRQFTIRGDSDNCSWHDLSPIAGIIRAFIWRQRLTELHVLFVRHIPLDILGQLVSAAPILSFCSVSFRFHPTIPVVVGPLGGSPIRELFLPRCPMLCDILALPQFAFCMTDLRKVGFSPHSDQDRNILSAAAGTLEHVRFQRLFNNSPILPLPPLAVLRSIDLAISAVHHIPWLIASITTISNSYPPTLEEIYVTYSADGHMFEPPPATMASLDSVLATCTGSPHIRWRFEFEWRDDGHHAARFTHLARFVELMLPTVRAAGRLSVERY